MRHRDNHLLASLVKDALATEIEPPTREEREQVSARASKTLARIMPFDEWKAEVLPTPADEELYFLTVRELESMAALRWTN